MELDNGNYDWNLTTKLTIGTWSWDWQLKLDHGNDHWNYTTELTIGPLPWTWPLALDRRTDNWTGKLFGNNNGIKVNKIFQVRLGIRSFVNFGDEKTTYLETLGWTQMQDELFFLTSITILCMAYYSFNWYQRIKNREISTNFPIKTNKIQ